MRILLLLARALVAGCATRSALDRLDEAQIELGEEQANLERRESEGADGQEVANIRENIKVLKERVKERKHVVREERVQSVSNFATKAAGVTDMLSGIIGNLNPAVGWGGKILAGVLSAVGLSLSQRKAVPV